MAKKKKKEAGVGGSVNQRQIGEFAADSEVLCRAAFGAHTHLIRGPLARREQRLAVNFDSEI